MATLDFSEFGTAEKEGWSRPDTAESYAASLEGTAAQSVPELLRQARIGPGKQVLDLCCGPGVVTAGLLAAGAEATGLDFSPAMLQLARQNVPDAVFVEGDAMNLPFEDACFDAVTIGFGILHVPDPVSVLQEAHRVLRKGGRLSFSVWHGPTIPTILGDLFQVIGRLGDPSVQLPPGPGLHDYADPEIVDTTLTKAGFSDISQSLVQNFVETQNADGMVTLFMEGTVRGGLLLRSQPTETLADIQAAMSELIKTKYGSNGPWKLPMPSVISAATAI
ncbi:Demethylmenaquinone methyltransferase [Ruegeria sp. THAF57]|uniref:class I SAM-dependent methyltransferase n=1 Tax=Ruegeria sp. THAF57 TaxID=2744555 RepID=UPI0015DF2B43|nr:methyltransferase domain-containing protein [Ruegeria sp. THAF57]CAD0186745.1 Demethylmenaquinone methyltransferase [Ruegeria sp. THAF57]